jgi:hypothetical protein
LVAITITDDTRDVAIIVESKEAFYRYQILDRETGDILLTSNNNSRYGVIDKSKLPVGTYDLKVYTSDFVITTDLEILKLGEFYAELNRSAPVALNE